MNLPVSVMVLGLIYVLASLTFIFGLKMLSHPRTARKGNALASLGMFLAIVGTITLFRYRENHEWVPLHNLEWIAGGLILGTAIGWVMALKVAMTAMPQMVSFFNGMGGACAALISLMELHHLPSAVPEGGNASPSFSGILTTSGILLSTLIGSVSFSGSMVAFGKLQGWISGKSIRLPLHQFWNALLLLGILILGGWLASAGQNLITGGWIILGLSLLYGILFVLPIGGADMPVVISLLNSFTGTAAGIAGFIYDNMAMIIGGILVGSAGTLLTILMCRAMNRSLWNVIIGAFSGSSAQEEQEKTVRTVTPEDAAIMLAYSNKVIFVPGYGLAVAQAQHTLHEVEKALQERGVDVRYAIHPVAGRMPGHMNVLLAEADVPYDLLMELEEANQEFPSTDVVVVIGANDVVNPLAETDPSSPIAGMPILQVYRAQKVIVIKRSLSPGYAGIDNPLFYRENTYMLFSDARKALEEVLKALQEV